MSAAKATALATIDDDAADVLAQLDAAIAAMSEADR
jgi:hypothetical protein